MGYGGMEELGPFKIHPNGTALYSNPYAWTQGIKYKYTTADPKKKLQASMAFSVINSSERPIIFF